MNDKKSYQYDIIEYLSEFSLEERLEIIANIFIYYGVSEMLSDNSITEEKLSTKKTIEVVLDDIQNNGNTLGNSLAMQGITILGWLDK